MPQKTLTQQNIQCHPNDLIFIQSRTEINTAIVEEYAAMMADGIIFDAVEGVQNESGQIFVWDGSHRGAAARKIGVPLLVNVRPGNKLEAEWLALAANQKHGLRRTTADKQQIIRKALLHPNGVNLSDREIARHCGVDHKTVGKIRRELEATGEIPQLSKRLVKKAGGETYEIDTMNIGGRQSVTLENSAPHLQPPANIQPIRRSALNTTHVKYTQPASTNCIPYAKSRADEHPKYQLKPQEFECPRCGQEKIVGVNGSRRWCLNCMAEWPTADAFLAEVNAGGRQNYGQLTRRQLQSRFQNILARLDEPELARIETWLDTLETQLDLTKATDHTNEEVAPINAIRVPEYA